MMPSAIRKPEEWRPQCKELAQGVLEVVTNAYEGEPDFFADLAADETLKDASLPPRAADTTNQK